MEAVTAVRYVNSAIFAGVKDERIYEKRQKKRPLTRPFFLEFLKLACGFFKKIAVPHSSVQEIPLKHRII
ncbi:hypothetical protein ASU80_20700 [Enterobacter hormaechei subsp. xiangfangensis]|nr:hypothetical protein ASU96_24365 [Enterobacter hormaechei subsp. xiangfangensis]KTJ63311.1 hypothetical protein ASU80_20700 [Enterobacter hormaechei subsp. xiangfangensis]KVI54323.1 hypothetical protein AWS50_16475 [Enterobacter hormaechei subsp. steigerwaltii]KVI55671.1 hypothetical protein AWS51_09200 [Enterobacter hormaechei subsp. steigerwaltii]